MSGPRAMASDFKNFIDGKWVASASETTFSSLNPANKTEVLGLFPRSDHRDVDRAVESARGHLAAWRLLPPSGRAEVIWRAAEQIRSQEEALATLITREMGKVLGEARVEVRETARSLRSIAGEGQRLAGTALPWSPSHGLAVRLRAPVGVVAAITPWNTPLAVPAMELGLALVAGNTVVFKPAEETPLVACRLVELILAAGLPPGVVNLVHGTGDEAGAPLVRHPDVSLVAFTGSGAVAREVAIACAAEGKRMTRRAGGTHALVVMDDADLGLAIAAALAGAFGASGQRDSAISRVVLHRAIAREFTERLVAKAEALRLGDGLLPATDMGPLVSEVRLKRVHAYARLGIKEGARLLCGGEPFREGDCKRGFFYPPTLLGDVRPAMRVAHEQVLGPAACLLTARDLAAAMGVLRDMRPTGWMSLYARDVQQALLTVRDLEADHIAINGSAAEWPEETEADLASREAWPGGFGRMDGFTRPMAVRLGVDPAGSGPLGG